MRVLRLFVFVFTRIVNLLHLIAQNLMSLKPAPFLETLCTPTLRRAYGWGHLDYGAACLTKDDLAISSGTWHHMSSMNNFPSRLSG